MDEQIILCDVNACKYCNRAQNRCTLAAIRVVPMESNQTAHFCGNYCKRD